MIISVITVCYNDKENLRKTIESVISQTYKNLEYIIIDGGSKDGTDILVSEYKKLFPITFLSEKDEGIYDAMNKGVKLSTGKWLNFMNAGDTFFNKNSLQLATENLSEEYDIVYGDTEIRYENFKIIKKEPKPNNLWMGRTPHQSSLIKSDTMRRYWYNKNNKIVADLEFFLTVYFNKGKIKKINQIISSFAKNGITEKLDKQVIIDAKKTVKKFTSNPLVDVYYTIIKIKPILKKILPKSIFKLLKNLSN